MNKIDSTWFRDIYHKSISNGTPFDLNEIFISELLERQNFRCAYTGEEISLPKIVPSSNSGKLVLKNKSLGMIQGNVILVSRKVAHMMNGLDELEFINLCQLIVESQT